MKLILADLKNDRQWAAVTGCKKAQFEKLLPWFQASYLELYEKSVAERQAALDMPAALPSEEALLFFTLFSLKTGLTYDALGFVSGMDGANAKRNQTLGLTVLQQALAQAECLPARTFANAEEFAAYLERVAEFKWLLFIDLAFSPGQLVSKAANLSSFLSYL